VPFDAAFGGTGPSSSSARRRPTVELRGTELTVAPEGAMRRIGMQTVVRLYELGIAACVRNDTGEARRVILDLIAALDFEFQEASRVLCRLYGQSLQRIEAGDFAGPLDTFLTLLTASTPRSPR
jgi:hypothetical protein